MRNKLPIVYVLYLVSLSLLLFLGGWQWSRGIEKSEIETLLESSKKQYITIDRLPQNWSEFAYRQVQLKGDWIEGRTFLMDNRLYQGRPGYEVFSPFRLAGDQTTLLVNRGWVGSADMPPTFEQKTGLSSQTVFRGQLYLPQKGFTLGPAYSDQPGWPRVIQYFDVSALSRVLGNELQPVVVVLDSSSPGSYERIWTAYVRSSARHYGYAVQWWGLAVLLIVFGSIWMRQLVQSRTGQSSTGKSFGSQVNE